MGEGGSLHCKWNEALSSGCEGIIDERVRESDTPKIIIISNFYLFYNEYTALVLAPFPSPIAIPPEALAVTVPMLN